MMLRTKSEQRAYLDGYEMCAECIEKYLTTEGKQKLECLLSAVRNAVEIEDMIPYVSEVTITQDDLAIEALYKEFAKWVAREIFDDMWEYNKDAFAEVACRKLAKLGIVRENGNVWELAESEGTE